MIILTTAENRNGLHGKNILEKTSLGSFGVWLSKVNWEKEMLLNKTNDWKGLNIPVNIVTASARELRLKLNIPRLTVRGRLSEKHKTRNVAALPLSRAEQKGGESNALVRSRPTTCTP